VPGAERRACPYGPVRSEQRRNARLPASATGQGAFAFWLRCRSRQDPPGILPSTSASPKTKIPPAIPEINFENHSNLARHHWLAVLAAVSLLVSISAFGAPKEKFAHYDRRPMSSAPTPSAPTLEAEARLRRQAPHVRVERHPLLGTPQWIIANDSFLTAPEAPAVGAARASDPHHVVKQFVNDYSNLFGHDAAALDAAKVKRDYTAAHTGMRTVVWEQQEEGIPLFESIFIAHTTKQGELVNVSSHFIPDLAGAVKRGNNPNITQPPLTASMAIAIACTNVGEASPVLSDIIAQGEPEAVILHQTFRCSAAKGDVDVRLVWLPLDSKRLRLCWDIVLLGRSTGAMYRVLVDAETGEVWVRRCLTDDISNASYRVFTGESPTPMAPGYSAPGNSAQPATVARTLVTLSALDTTASPNGWIDDGVNETRGNNVDAHTDIDDDNVADLPRPQGSPSRVFDFSMSLAQGPDTYSKAAVVNLFYWCNWMHDKLYQFGFTEAAGNFQNNNFGKGGLGNDAVQADAQDGSGLNNSNFGTPPDGQAPRMQMYIFDGPSPARDGDLDTTVILHEYTHGLSNRRVGGGVGISALQAAGMGEGWSDFYALALLSTSSQSLAGNYPLGSYAMKDSKAYGAYTSTGDNYFYGIRRYPYSTNLSVNPLTFKDIDPTQKDPHVSVPRSPLFSGSSAAEVHNIGEVWCAMLWDARANFISKLGYSNGNKFILQIVTDGMGLAPANPTFVQARDAILQAELVYTAGTNKNELWAAFARRGLGFDAIAPPVSQATGVLESFSLPDTLRITPPGDTSIFGYAGGTFNFASTNFTLSNSGPASLTWTAVAPAPLSVSVASGTLAPGAKQTVTVTLNAAQAALVPTSTNWLVQFSNQVSHISQARRFKFSVIEPLSFLGADTISFVGPQGGPFTSDDGIQVITNNSAKSMSWTTFVPDGWVATPNSGTLAAHGTVVMDMHPDASANLLPIGHNSSSLYLTNLFTGGGDVRTLNTDVKNDSYLSAGYSSLNPFNLSNKTVTFFPDNTSPKGYAVCIDAAVGFPTSPSGGTSLTHDNYSFTHSKEIYLANGAQVSLFGLTTNHVWVHSDGRITFKDEGTLSPVGYMDEHLSHLEVAGMFSKYSDFDSIAAGGSVSWKQTSDRFTVTWQKLSCYLDFSGTSLNDFQVELFFNGVIRITTLGAYPEFGVLGLSRGTNISYAINDFIDTDFASQTSCSQLLPTLSVTGPATVTEGAAIRPGAGHVRLATPLSTNLLVTLSSSDTSEITVPASVLLPAGATNVNFNITAPDDNLLDGTQSAIITASASLFNSGHTTIIVYDNESVPLHVLMPATLTEGGGYATAQVYTSTPVDADVLVYLTASGDVQLPFLPFTLIHAGQTTANFQVRATDDGKINGTRLANVVASVSNWTSGVGFTQIHDNETTNLTVVGPLFVSEGDGVLPQAGEVRLSGTLTTNLTVTISSGTVADIQSPGQVVIPAGQTNAFFDLNVGENSVVDGLRLCYLTASAPGFTNGVKAIFVVDNDGPPALVRPSPVDQAIDVPLDADLGWGQTEGQLIVNGGFESGTLSGWTREDSTSGGGFVVANNLFDPVGPDGSLPPFAGSRYALTQSYGNGKHTLWQEFIIPDGLANVTLTWAERVHNHAGIWSSNQQYRVELRNTANVVLATLRSTQPGDPVSGGWTNFTVNLWEYRGQTLRLAFVEEDTLGAINVSLDGVSVLATPAAPTTFDIYFGTKTIPDATELLGSTTNNYWILPPLTTNTLYHWQVKSRRAGITNAGPVWQFTTIDITNRPPIVALGNPGNFAVLRSPTNVLMDLATLKDAGTITAVHFYADGQKIGQAIASPFNFTWVNAPIGEHSLFAVAYDDSSLNTTSAVQHITVLPPGGNLVTLIPYGATWRYLDDGSNPGSKWRATSFSTEKTWSNAPAKFGFGEGDEATLVDFGNDPNNKFVTTYFRAHFTPPSGIQNLYLHLRRNDGAAVYLNGTEVLRNNLASSATYLSNAITDLSALNEKLILTTSLSTTGLNLRSPNNTIAAEVHIARSNSVNMAFDLELTADVNIQPSVVMTSPEDGSLFLAPTNLLLSADAFDAYGTLTKVEFFDGNVSLGILTNAPFSMTWTNPPTMDHIISATATDDQGAVTSSGGVFVQVVVPSPLLSVTNSGPTVDLAWPVAAINYHVEMTTNLVPPVLWERVTNVATLTNGMVHLSLPPGAASPQFFRLTVP
jgi:Fungalysin metallopeptidase (M36)/Bacterial Ig domain/Fungalysin/Thermolysin Propeptide Motif